MFTCRGPADDLVRIRLASWDESCGFTSSAIMASAVTTLGGALADGAAGAAGAGMSECDDAYVWQVCEMPWGGQQ